MQQNCHTVVINKQIEENGLVWLLIEYMYKLCSGRYWEVNYYHHGVMEKTKPQRSKISPSALQNG